MSAKGRCLCGNVNFTTNDDVNDISICHCSLCRRWNSGPMFALHLSTPPTIDGEEHITWYKSSDWASRGFCQNCGTSLFYKLDGDTEAFFASAGAVEDQSALHLASQIFIDEKPDYYAFAGNVPAMTGEEVFAMFADSDTTQSPEGDNI